MRILAFDPAGNKFGVACIDVVEGQMDLSLSFVIETPEEFTSTMKTQYVSFVSAALVGLTKPNQIVSEFPWGAGGFSSQNLKEIIGALKAEIWQNIRWQGVSEARRIVLGDGYGGSDKPTTSEWLLEYPWNIKSKRKIRQMIDNANPQTKDGYDILDAIMHGVCYLVSEKLIERIIKPEKVKKTKKK